MATITVRNLPDDVHDRLRVRAARKGQSMEAEVRAILRDATASDTPDSEAGLRRLSTLVDRLYGARKPRSVVDDFIAGRRREAEREEEEYREWSRSTRRR